MGGERFINRRERQQSDIWPNVRASTRSAIRFTRIPIQLVAATDGDDTTNASTLRKLVSAGPKPRGVHDPDFHPCLFKLCPLSSVLKLSKVGTASPIVVVVRFLPCLLPTTITYKTKRQP